jgi:hypothetical protein
MKQLPAVFGPANLIGWGWEQEADGLMSARFYGFCQKKLLAQ